MDIYPTNYASQNFYTLHNTPKQGFLLGYFAPKQPLIFLESTKLTRFQKNKSTFSAYR